MASELDDRPKDENRFINQEGEDEEWRVVQVGPIDRTCSARWPIHSGEAHALLLGKQVRAEGSVIEVTIWGESKPVRLGVIAHDGRALAGGDKSAVLQDEESRSSMRKEDEPKETSLAGRAQETSLSGADKGVETAEVQEEEYTTAKRKEDEPKDVDAEFEQVCTAFRRLSLEEVDVSEKGKSIIPPGENKRKQDVLDAEDSRSGENAEDDLSKRMQTSLRLSPSSSKIDRADRGSERVKRIGPSTIVLVHSVLFVENKIAGSTAQYIDQMLDAAENSVPWMPLDELKHAILQPGSRCLIEYDSGSMHNLVLRRFFSQRAEAVTTFWISPEDVWLRDDDMLPERFVSDIFLAASLVNNTGCIIVDGLDELFAGGPSSKSALTSEWSSWPVLVQFLVELDRNPSVTVFGLIKRRSGNDGLLEPAQQRFSRRAKLRSPFGLSEWRQFWHLIPFSRDSLSDIESLCAKSTGLALNEVLKCVQSATKRSATAEELGLKIEAMRAAVKDRTFFAGDVPFTFVPSSSKTLLASEKDFASQVAGQYQAKQMLVEALLWPKTRSIDLRRLNIRPIRGIILYGPPGTGKTLLARSAAWESQWNFLSVSVSDLVRGDVGQSEKRVRDLFNLAKSCAPCVLFFDEAQGLFTSRSLLGPAGRKLVSQFLVELDALRQEDQIVLLAATNHIERLDDALVRPGRFDRKVLVGPLVDTSDVLRAVQLKTKEVANVSFERIKWEGTMLSKLRGLTGAEIAQVLIRAGMECEQRNANAATGQLLFVEDQDVDSALREEGLLDFSKVRY